MTIKFKAKEKFGDLIIESDQIKQTWSALGGYIFGLWHVYFTEEQHKTGMWIQIDEETLEIIKEL